MSDLNATSLVPVRSKGNKLRDRGAVTAEYALLTIGTITFGGIILKIITDEGIRNSILQLILAIIKFILSNFGVL